MKPGRSARELLPQLAAAALVLTFLATCCDAAPAPAGPARWRPYDLIVELRDLPKSYSCDQLYYKFWEVLWTLGARSNMKILTYDCRAARLGHPANMTGRSPRVHLQFTLPDALPGGEARWADLEAVRRTVRLEPGHPQALDSADCALLEQIKETLLPALPVHIVGSRWQCTDGARSAHFSVSISVLTPAARAAARAAA